MLTGRAISEASEAGRKDLLAAEIRRRLGPPRQLKDWPLVSIVVLNRDGASHLRRLLNGLVEKTDYPSLELIAVDNASADDSLDLLRAAEAPFPISIVANAHNESFSDACNQGAKLAAGELLLFLNNDTEPFEPGWLRELVDCRRQSGAGAVSATLLCRDEEHEAGYRHGFGVQHRGLQFRQEGELVGPVLREWGADPLDHRLGEDVECAAVPAACLLVERGSYERVGGFTHGYVYGAEDVDLCFELQQAGRRVVCSGRSIAIHHPASTRRTAPFEDERARKLANRRLLWERWGPRLRREYELDRLKRRGVWAERESGGPPSSRGELEALGFCFKATASEENGTGHQGSTAGVCDELRRRDHRCRVLHGAEADDLAGIGHDVAVHLRGPRRYTPKPAQLNVLWSVSHFDALAAIEASRYDLVVSDREDLIRRLREEGLPVEALALLEGTGAESLAAGLVAAVQARARAIGFRTRIVSAAGSV